MSHTAVSYYPLSIFRMAHIQKISSETFVRSVQHLNAPESLISTGSLMVSNGDRGEKAGMPGHKFSLLSQKDQKNMVSYCFAECSFSFFTKSKRMLPSGGKLYIRM